MAVYHLSTQEKAYHIKAVELADAQLEAARGMVADKLKSLTSKELDQAAAALASAISMNYLAEITRLKG